MLRFDGAGRNHTMAKKRFMNQKMNFPSEDPAALEDGLRYIEESLAELGVNKKLAMRTLLTAEEMIPQFLQHAKPGSHLRIQVKHYLGDVSVTISVPGSEFDPTGQPLGEIVVWDEMGDDEAQQAIRSILLRSQSDKLKITYKNGINYARILVGQSSKSTVFLTLSALILGILFGVLMKAAFPQVLSDGIGTYLLNPVQTMFMNALKIIIGPVVFFSIVSCIAEFKDLAELGKIVAKIMGLYMMTTVFSILVALGISTLLHPGQFGAALSQTLTAEAVSSSAEVDTSILNMIVNIVPSNFVRPFLESDTLQIIFLAVLCGIAVGTLGKYTEVLQDFFEACNSLFLTITTMISRLIPLAVFCSSALMIVEMGGGAFLTLMGYTGTFILGILCMMAVYALLILVLGNLNPIHFFRKDREGMLTSLTLSSSSAAIHTNMRVCTEKLGISPKISNFSIPLGATVNMDGACIFQITTSLFLARMYGVTVSPSMLISLSILVIMLSLGSPGVPGAGFVCFGMVVAHLGVPIEALGIVMGIYPILDMIITMSNTTGDVAASLIVAKSEGLLDLEKYSEKS